MITEVQSGERAPLDFEGKNPILNVRTSHVANPSSGDTGQEVMTTIDALRIQAAQEVDLLIWSIRLENVKRFHGQRFWEKETVASDHASLIDEFPQLENVAAHNRSWYSQMLRLERDRLWRILC